MEKKLDSLFALETAFFKMSLAVMPLSASSEETMENPTNQVEYAMFNGKAISQNIYRVDEIAIARTMVVVSDLTKPACWQRHHHPETEILIPVSGKGVLYSCSKEGVLKTGKCSAENCFPESCESAIPIPLIPGTVIYLKPDNIHSAMFNENSLFIAITVPASHDFPGIWRGPNGA